ncbi:MAG: c-type cytochrome [Bacteroidota bacterium]
MKKVIFIFSVLFVAASCSKTKAPVPFITEDCQDTIKFSTQILPLISDNCFSCHGVGMGQSPTFSDYTTIMSNADKILKTMRGDGAPQMPDGADPLHDTLIRQFSCWIAQGKLNN